MTLLAVNDGGVFKTHYIKDGKAYEAFLDKHYKDKLNAEAVREAI